MRAINKVCGFFLPIILLLVAVSSCLAICDNASAYGISSDSNIYKKTMLNTVINTCFNSEFLNNSIDSTDVNIYDNQSLFFKGEEVVVPPTGVFWDARSLHNQKMHCSYSFIMGWHEADSLLQIYGKIDAKASDIGYSADESLECYVATYTTAGGSEHTGETHKTNTVCINEENKMQLGKDTGDPLFKVFNWGLQIDEIGNIQSSTGTVTKDNLAAQMQSLVTEYYKEEESLIDLYETLKNLYEE